MRSVGGWTGGAGCAVQRRAGQHTQAFESSAAAHLLRGAGNAPCAAVQIFEVQEEFSIGVSCAAAAAAAAARLWRLHMPGSLRCSLHPSP